jgi:hypothetical protein
VSILTIRFAFGSGKISLQLRRCSFFSYIFSSLRRCISAAQNRRFFSRKFSHKWLGTALQANENIYEKSVLSEAQHSASVLTSTWKSYMRKSAAFTARTRLCSEIFPENGEKYPEN